MHSRKVHRAWKMEIKYINYFEWIHTCFRWNLYSFCYWKKVRNKCVCVVLRTEIKILFHSCIVTRDSTENGRDIHKAIECNQISGVRISMKYECTDFGSIQTQCSADFHSLRFSPGFYAWFRLSIYVSPFFTAFFFLLFSITCGNNKSCNQL